MGGTYTYYNDGHLCVFTIYIRNCAPCPSFCRINRKYLEEAEPNPVFSLHIGNIRLHEEEGDGTPGEDLLQGPARAQKDQ